MLTGNELLEVQARERVHYQHFSCPKPAQGPLGPEAACLSGSNQQSVVDHNLWYNNKMPKEDIS